MSTLSGKSILLFFLRFYLFIFRESGREGEKEEEKHQCVVASCVPPTGHLGRNSAMCSDWESNQQTFGSQAGMILSPLSHPSQGLSSMFTDPLCQSVEAAMTRYQRLGSL